MTQLQWRGGSGKKLAGLCTPGPPRQMVGAEGYARLCTAICLSAAEEPSGGLRLSLRRRPRREHGGQECATSIPDHVFPKLFPCAFCCGVAPWEQPGAKKTKKKQEDISMREARWVADPNRQKEVMLPQCHHSGLEHMVVKDRFPFSVPRSQSQ